MIFCKHKWVILSEITTKAPIQVACEALERLMPEDGRFEIPEQMSQTERKLIQLVSCEKCRKIKKFVEVLK